MAETNSTVESFKLRKTQEAKIVSCWQQFISEFPAQRDCFDELYRRSSVDKCTDCKSGEFDRNLGDRLLKCRRCGKKTSLTAGTFFNGVKKPQAWLGAIWLMEKGVCISALRFHRLAGIAYSSAHHIFKKLSTVIESHMTGERVPSALFAPVFAKRSRETPARSHPVTEEAELVAKDEQHDKGYPSQCISTENQDDTVHISEQEKLVYECLSEEPVHFDNLCTRSGLKAGEISSVLTMLELNGHITRMEGNRFTRSIDTSCPISARAGEPSKTLLEIIEGTIDYLRSQFHAISRKYLQNYLALLWCLSDRSRWTAGSLLKACFCFRHISNRDTLNYVSPSMVKLFVRAE